MRAQVQAVPTGARARDAGANDATARSSAADLQEKQTGAAKLSGSLLPGGLPGPRYLSFLMASQIGWLSGKGLHSRVGIRHKEEQLG